jgi:hypothetical protein
MNLTIDVGNEIVQLSDLADDLDASIPQQVSPRRAGLIPVDRKTMEAYIREVMEACERRTRELYERFLALRDHMYAQIQCMTKHMQHRTHGRSSSSGKSSSKRTSSSSGGSSGGDGGGDGDGPARTPSRKSKKPRSKPCSTSLQHPPSSSHGEIATTSFPKVSPHRPLPGREIVTLVILCLYGIAYIAPSAILQGLIIFCLLIIALVAMGYPEVARYVWSTVPKLLKQLATDSDEESEDPDEES